MFVKLLTEPDKKHLLDLVTLLSLSDNTLLWDGNTKDSITSSTNLEKLTIQSHDFEFLNSGMGGLHKTVVSGSIETKLISKLKTYPLQKIEQPEIRLEAALTVLKELLKEKNFPLPSVPKIMLFEMMLVALCSEKISGIEWALLKEFQHHHKLEDFIFEDMLERAETTARETSKTLSIILE